MFKAWLRNQHKSGPLPINPEWVEQYLVVRHKQGTSAATLRQICTAIDYSHRRVGQPSPCKTERTRAVLRGLLKKRRTKRQKAEPLTADRLEKVCNVASVPQRIGPGRFESDEQARKRGLLTIALIRTMRDAMLSSTEAEKVLWSDIETKNGGEGWLTVKRSKPGQRRQTNWQDLSKKTMQTLRQVKEFRKGENRVFGLSARQIVRCIAAACKKAGLEGHYTGASPRVGMTVDMIRDGIDRLEIQEAGGWKSRATVDRYAREDRAPRTVE